MPPRSKIAMLPQAMRDELERLIVERAFSGYKELADWLQKQGYEIAENSVQRYGAKLHQKIEAFDRAAHRAKTIAEAGAKDAGVIIDAAIHLLNMRVFSKLVESEHIDQADLASLSRTLADLSKIIKSQDRPRATIRGGA